MRCPACNHENREGAKFCEDCATPLSTPAPQAVTSAGPGALATTGGVAAGESGVAIGHDVTTQNQTVVLSLQSGSISQQLDIEGSSETAPAEIHWSERNESSVSYFKDALNQPNIPESELLKLFHEWGLVTTSQGGHFTIAGASLFCPKDRFHKGFHSDVQINGSNGLISNLNGLNLVDLYSGLHEELSHLWENVWEDPSKRDLTGKPMTITRYPRGAITEALVNFIIHRDYKIDDLAFVTIREDYVEFINPGVSSYSPKELVEALEPLRPKYERNPTIIKVFSRTSLNQRQGGGIIRIRKLLQENSNLKEDRPALEIENDTSKGRFRIRIYARSILSISAVSATVSEISLGPVLLNAYLNYLCELVRSLPLAGVDRKSISEDTRSDLDLARVYTALMTQRIESERELTPQPDREPRRLSALEVLNTEKHLALLGDPGSGKSTFVNFAALCLAGELLGRPDANLRLLTSPLPDDEQNRERDERPKPQSWDHGPLLPVRVVLRDLAARGLPPPGQLVSGDTLWKFIVAELPETLREFAKPLRDELLSKGGLLLLDGLDEVPEADQRREQVKAAVRGFTAAFPNVRVLATSRTYAYQKQKWKLRGFAEAVLAPFDPQQIGRFVERWYAYVGEARRLNSQDAQGKAAQLNDAIHRSPRLSELAARPLLLTLMASLHAWRGGALPDQREELYADAVDLLLDQWESQKARRKPDGGYELIQPSLAEWLRMDQKVMRSLLNRLAFEAHRDQPTLTGTADILQDKLVRELMKHNLNPDARPARVVEYLSFRAGLLEPRGVGVYTFPHRTFQEYLAACYLTDHGFPDEMATLLRADPNRWREVTLLAGAKAARGTASAAWTLADALCFNDLPTGRPTDSELGGALLAAQVLVENNSLTYIADRNRSKVDRLRRWLTHIVVEGLLPPADRVQVGDALALFGDPRNLEELVTISAGKFWMGNKEGGLSFVANHPQHELSLTEYKIGKYPVTVGLWRQFVDATGYKCDSDSLRDHDNRPAHDVSWHDARAFCEWLTSEWHKQSKIKVDEVARLPTEAEWEKAARGADKRDWPWGNEFVGDCANTSEGDIGRTSAVGMFPTGASPYGCLDMVGNVWEWCQSKNMKYPYKIDDGREDLKGDDACVLRGGSFYDNLRYTQCAFRHYLQPDSRVFNLGFRVVVSPGSRS